MSAFIFDTLVEFQEKDIYLHCNIFQIAILKVKLKSFATTFLKVNCVNKGRRHGLCNMNYDIIQ